MTGFTLSPGITPELTDLFVLELPVLLAAGYALRKGRGFEVALALNALALGAIKFATDFTDLPDDVVSIAGLLGGAGVLTAGGAGWRPRIPPVALWRLLGVLFVLVGAVKALRDFYDPFDLLLADTAIACGGLLALLPQRVLPTSDPPSVVSL
ncbi:MAG: hypothetical protein L3K09_04920 [Thermoplasmata archaeon]|nr:hypothetical protein [Thermoplasmata archaeon]